MMGDNDFKIQSVTFVYNEVLIRNFVGQYLIQSERARADPKLFKKQQWTQGKNQQEASWVYNHFQGNFPFLSKSVSICFF